MKNPLLILLFFSLSIGYIGCQRPDYDLIDGQRPEQRIDQRMAEHRTQLLGAEHGWKAYLYTSLANGGYGFYMQFSEDNHVRMISDIDETSATRFERTSFRLEHVMVPSLNFENYTYISKLQDPNPNTLGGIQGAGFGSDIEFEFRDVSADTIRMRGKKWDTELVLVRATQEEKQFFESGAYATAIAAMDAAISRNFYSIGTGLTATEIYLDNLVYSRVVAAYYLSADTLAGEGMEFAYTASGIVLRQPIDIAGNIVSEFRIAANGNDLVGISPTGSEVAIQRNDALQIPLHYSLGTDIHSEIITEKNLPERLFSPLARTFWNHYLFNLTYNLNLRRIIYTFNQSSNTIIAVMYATQGVDPFEFQIAYEMSYELGADNLYQIKSLTPLPPNGPLLLDIMSEYFAPLLHGPLLIESVPSDPEVGKAVRITSTTVPNYWLIGSLH